MKQCNAILTINCTWSIFHGILHRFHELSEFDEAKRSCRRRLAGHNERRRKSSTESSAEGSSRKGISPQLKESHCRQADDQRARVLITIPGNSSFKRSQIR